MPGRGEHLCLTREEVMERGGRPCSPSRHPLPRRPRLPPHHRVEKRSRHRPPSSAGRCELRIPPGSGHSCPLVSWAQPCAEALCLNGMISPAAPLPPPHNCTEKAPQIVLRMCGTTRPETRPRSAGTASLGLGDSRVPLPSVPDTSLAHGEGRRPSALPAGRRQVLDQ